MVKKEKEEEEEEKKKEKEEVEETRVPGCSHVHQSTSVTHFLSHHLPVLSPDTEKLSGQACLSTHLG